MSTPAFHSKLLPLSTLKSTGTKPLMDKVAKLGGASVVGNALGGQQMFADGVSYLQEFESFVLFYHPAYGVVSLNQALYKKWKSPSVAGGKTSSGGLVRDYLGFPVSDSFNTGERGGSAAYFERGMIVVRANQQAYVVYGAIYERYRRLAGLLGLPVSDEEPAANGGRRSRFDGGDIYWTPASGAHEVHGAIRERWLAMGGAGSVLGYPVSDESPVMNGSQEIGRFNRFNGGYIYWTPASGAWDIYGAIYAEWQSNGGPLGPLGFPISGETDTPAQQGFVQGRFNDFQNGVIVWYPSGDFAGVHTVLGVQLYLQRYDCNDDFNVQINIEATPANPPNLNHGRMPSGGEYGGGGKELNTVLLTVPLVRSDTQINIWMLCIHENTIGKDDREGTVTANYNILNVWGRLENNFAHQDGAFTATFEMKPFPLPPVSLDPDLFRKQFFWPFQNFDTDTLSWRTYSDTFSDVAETDKKVNLNPFEFKLHLFEIAFYEMVYKTMGKGGNCFGLCLESIYARENRSLFIEPVFNQNSYDKGGELLADDGTALAETTGQTPSAQDAEIVSEANIKHGYQLGASFVEWFLGKWITGGIHQPIDAFYDSKKYFESGDWPVLTVSTDGDLSQTGHVLVPYKWSPPQGGPLTIWVANINDPPAIADNNDPHNLITVYPDNSFTFQMHDGLSGMWFGSPDTGGRLLAIPYSQLNSQPVTPGDAIFALIVSGAVIICAGDGHSTQITDEQGKTFYTTGSLARGVSHAERLNIPGAHPSQGLPGRRINVDPRTAVPQMARIPMHGRAVYGTEGQSDLGAIANLRNSQTPPEVYYLHRSAEFMSMQPSQPVLQHPSGKNPRSVVGMQENLAASGSGTATPVAANIESRTASRTELRTIHDETGSAEVELPKPYALTFDVQATADGSYKWAILSPRMSASITAQCSNGLSDTIHIDSVNSHDQCVTFSAPANSPARSISMAVGSFSGGDPAERRWYELVDMNIAPGQTISAQVNNRGEELLLRNTGPAVAFELRVHYGMDPAHTAVRTAVPLAGNMAFHIAPQEWDQQTIAKTQVQMTVFNPVSGTQVGQMQL